RAVDRELRVRDGLRGDGELEAGAALAVLAGRAREQVGRALLTVDRVCRALDDLEEQVVHLDLEHLVAELDVDGRLTLDRLLDGDDRGLLRGAAERHEAGRAVD